MLGAVCALAPLIPVPAQDLYCHLPLVTGESSQVANRHARGRGQVGRGHRPVLLLLPGPQCPIALSSRGTPMSVRWSPWGGVGVSVAGVKNTGLAVPSPTFTFLLYHGREGRPWTADPSSSSRSSAPAQVRVRGALRGLKKLTLMKCLAHDGCPGNSIFLLFSSPNVQSVQIFFVREYGGDRRWPGVGISEFSV